MNDNELNDLLVQLNFCNSDYTHADYDTFENSIKAIEQLRKERDEARRMYCSKVEGNSRQYGTSSKDVAKQLNWDCFEKETP